MDWAGIFRNSVSAFFGVEAMVYAIAAIGLNLHFGYTGLLNFGQVAFMAMGAYGIGLAVTALDLSLWLGIPVGILLAVALALLLGAPTLRLRADYLAIVTIAASEIIRLLNRSVTLSPITGGSTGLSAFAEDFYAINPLPPGDYGIGPITYGERTTWVLLVGWSIVALLSLLVYVLMHSPWGRVLRSIREDEDAARSLGKNVYGYKMQSLILGGVIAAIAGILLASATQSIQPDNYSPPFTFFIYTVLILGGTARVGGPVIGSMIFWFLLAFVDSTLRGAVAAGYIPDAIVSNEQVGISRFILVGLGLMLLMIYRPQGIFGNRREIALEAR